MSRLTRVRAIANCLMSVKLNMKYELESTDLTLDDFECRPVPWVDLLLLGDFCAQTLPDALRDGGAIELVGNHCYAGGTKESPLVVCVSRERLSGDGW